MKIVYTILIRFYRLALGFVSLWNPKAKKWINGRKNWQVKLTYSMQDKQSIYWFHCASLGEFEQARPLIEKLKTEKSETTILISFFSPSGYEMMKNYELADYVCYLPLDTKSNAKKFISAVNFTKAYFVKYEVWPNYFKELSNQKIPFYLISATFRQGQIYFKPTGKWFKNLLKLPTQIFVQDEASKEVLKAHDVDSLVAGDTRYDRVVSTAKKAVPNEIIKQFSSSKFTLIGGSSWEKEEEMISSAFYQLSQSFKVVFAPHDISENHVKGILSRLKKDTKVIRYSQVDSSVNLRDFDVLILDNMGLLSNAYQYGSAAFVGGGFTNALHNILEPATFGLPVFYGNYHPKFPEGELMSKEGSGIMISSLREFKIELDNLIKNPEILNQKTEINSNFISQRTGATDFIFSGTIDS